MYVYIYIFIYTSMEAMKGAYEEVLRLPHLLGPFRQFRAWGFGGIEQLRETQTLKARVSI